MNILRVNFGELYERHLCRHSQFGLNVAHLLSVVVIYLGICGLVSCLFDSGVLLVALALPYLVIMAVNVPARVLVTTIVFMALLFAGFFALPHLPWWAYVVAIVVSHRLQAWQHRIYTAERDMSDYTEKYKKGLVLFVLLAVYELPILLNYLVWDRKSWASPALPAETVGASKDV